MIIQLEGNERTSLVLFGLMQLMILSLTGCSFSYIHHSCPSGGSVTALHQCAESATFDFNFVSQGDTK